MLSKILEGLYLKVFVNIVVEYSRSIVYIELCNKSNVIDSAEESFDTTTMNVKMFDFISSYTSESPFHYISLLDKSLSQGAAPTCTTKNMSLYFDTSSSKYKCYKERWSYYTSKFDLMGFEKEYKQIGIDFIFSPFVILAHFFQDKINNHLAIFILVEEKYISLSVFDKAELLYAEHIDIEKHVELEDLIMDESSTDEMELHLDKSIDLEDVDVEDDLDSLDDFGNIEDLDSIEDIDEFSQDVEEELNQKMSEEFESNEDAGFNEDYQRFLLIQSSINHFYKDDRFKSKFVETAYIADAIHFTPELKKYLEEEMFLSVYVRHIDLRTELCEMAKAELK